MVTSKSACLTTTEPENGSGRLWAFKKKDLKLFEIIFGPVLGNDFEFSSDANSYEFKVT